MLPPPPASDVFVTPVSLCAGSHGQVDAVTQEKVGARIAFFVCDKIIDEEKIQVSDVS